MCRRTGLALVNCKHQLVSCKHQAQVPLSADRVSPSFGQGKKNGEAESAPAAPAAPGSRLRGSQGPAHPPGRPRSSPGVLLGVSHRETFPSWRHTISASPSRAPGAQERVNGAGNLGATRGRGTGCRCPLALSQTASQLRASSVTPSQTRGRGWAGPAPSSAPGSA